MTAPTPDVQAVSLCPGEGESLVEDGIIEHILSLLPNNLRLQILPARHL